MNTKLQYGRGLFALATLTLAAAAVAAPAEGPTAPDVSDALLSNSQEDTGESAAAPEGLDHTPDPTELAENKKCVWEGKAPACNGKCSAGFKVIKRDKSGDGKKCVTGSKAYCCLTNAVKTRGKAPFCAGKCKPGEVRVGDSDKGENGNQCQTGKAAVCLI